MKTLILTGKYAQDIEVHYPFYRLKEEGWDVDVAVEGDKEVLGVYGMRITPTLSFADIKVFDYRVLILPGGARALEYLRQNQDILHVINSFHAIGNVIGSICHGTQLLISAGLVRKKRVSGYYSIKDDIKNAGGIFIDAPVVVDGRIVSCPHYKYMGPWMKAVVDCAKSI